MDCFASLAMTTSSRFRWVGKAEACPPLRAECRWWHGATRLRPPYDPLLRSSHASSLLPIAHAHAGAHVALDAVRRDRVAQAIFGKLLHAADGFREMGRLQRH